MPIRLVYSQRTESLVDALADALSAERAARGPLEPAHLVVPSRNLERHVVLALAERLGIAANLRFHRLESFVGRWLARELAPLREGAAPLRVLDRRAFEAFVLGALLDERFFAHPDATPLARYVGREAGARGTSERRLAQLASRVARLFEAYAYSRPELLAAWADGRTTLDARAEAAETERWQRHLYGEVRSRAAPRGFVPLHEALAQLSAASPRAGVLPPSVHVVGLSYVARLFQWVFGALGVRTELGLYVLNPCREFWEDVPSESELRARLPRRGRAR
ncbi:MAG: exodeoxyribonuclease V subunit gamma, partial [Myxococcales bacterium]|nr:exodeoxyribonuclease V subunit gamma [Myxococcales bacterium]